jgi:alkylation response protein AidB-like acyl-CoA dehydrogenase
MTRDGSTGGERVALVFEETEYTYAQLDVLADGSLDKLLMTWTEQAAGHASIAVAGTGDPELLSAYLYSRAQSVMGGTSQIQKNVIAARILGLGA